MTQAELKGQWENEKGVINVVRDLKGEIEQTRLAIDDATRRGDLQAASELKYAKLPELEKRLHEAENGQEAPRLLKQEVRPDDVADIVARWTGIPVTRLLQSERDKLIHLPDKLHERVIGQDEAVQPGPGCPTPRVRRARSFSSARRVWARRSCARPWPKRSLTAKRTSCAST